MESFMAFDARFFIQNFLELSFCFVGAISCSVSVCLCFYVRNINGLCFASSHNSVSTLAWCEWLHFFWIWLLKNYIFLRWWMKNMCLTCKWVFPERLLFMVVWSDTGGGRLQLKVGVPSLVLLVDVQILYVSDTYTPSNDTALQNCSICVSDVINVTHMLFTSNCQHLTELLQYTMLIVRVCVCVFPAHMPVPAFASLWISMDVCLCLSLSLSHSLFICLQLSPFFFLFWQSAVQLLLPPSTYCLTAFFSFLLASCEWKRSEPYWPQNSTLESMYTICVFSILSYFDLQFFKSSSIN